MKYLIWIVLILLIPFTIAQLGYNNPKLPRIEAHSIAIQPINNNTVNVNNSNCWLGDCGGFRNPFNQNLNTTNTPTFAGSNSNGAIIIDVLLAEWVRFTSLGGILNIGHITSGAGVYQFEPFAGTDMYVGNCSKSCFQFGDGGIGTLASALSNRLGIGSQATIETNLTKTQFNSVNLVFNGTYAEWNNTRQFKANNTNITSLHQNYNLTANISFGTLYTNNLDRPILIQASALGTTQAISFDSAFIQIHSTEGGLFVNKTAPIGIWTANGEGEGFEAVTVVQPSANWEINSTTSGSGAVLLRSVWITVL